MYFINTGPLQFQSTKRIGKEKHKVNANGKVEVNRYTIVILVVVVDSY